MRGMVGVRRAEWVRRQNVELAGLIGMLVRSASTEQVGQQSGFEAAGVWHCRQNHRSRQKAWGRVANVNGWGAQACEPVAQVCTQGVSVGESEGK